MLNTIKRSAMGGAALAVLTLAAYGPDANQISRAARLPEAGSRSSIRPWRIWASNGRSRATPIAMPPSRSSFAVWARLTRRKGLPLVRIGGERIFRDVENLSYIVPDGFAGSILGLEPGTEYEARFTPDRS